MRLSGNVALPPGAAGGSLPSSPAPGDTLVFNEFTGLWEPGELFVRTAFPIPGTTTMGTSGLQAISNNGTAAAVAPTGASYFNSRQRTRYTSTAGANQNSGLIPTVNKLCIPGSVLGVGGYRVGIDFGFDTIPALTRCFVGLATGNPVSSQEPTAEPNIHGVGWSTGETTFHELHNDGAGVAPSTDFGAAFAINKVYRLVVSSGPLGTGFRTRLYELISGVGTLLGTLDSASDLPAAYMGPGVVLNTSAGVVATQTSFFHIGLWVP